MDGERVQHIVQEVSAQILKRVAIFLRHTRLAKAHGLFQKRMEVIKRMVIKVYVDGYQISKEVTKNALKIVRQYRKAAATNHFKVSFKEVKAHGNNP